MACRSRIGRDYQVIGPAFEIPLLTGKQQAPELLGGNGPACYIADIFNAEFQRLKKPSLHGTGLSRPETGISKNAEEESLQEEISRREFFSGIFKPVNFYSDHSITA